MAVGRKPTDYQPHYHPEDDDLTNDQIHRFTQVANKKELEKEEREIEKQLEHDIEMGRVGHHPTEAQDATHRPPPRSVPLPKRKRSFSLSWGRARKRNTYFYAIVRLLILFIAVSFLFG